MCRLLHGLHATMQDMHSFIHSYVLLVGAGIGAAAIPPWLDRWRPCMAGLLATMHGLVATMHGCTHS